MYLSDQVLGTTTTRKLREGTAQAILQIGTDSFTRKDLAGVECYNFVAAANLSAILNRELQVKNLREVFEKVSPQALALPRLGAISLAVLGAAFEAKDIGGSEPLEAWVNKHLGGKNGKLVAFTTLKHRDEAERAKERAEHKQRKRQRRNQAHRLRVERFTTVAGKGPTP